MSENPVSEETLAEQTQSTKTGTMQSQVIAMLIRFAKSRNGPLLIGLLVYIVVIATIQPAFLSAYNISNVMLQVSVAGIVTLGMTLMIITGQIDLSVGFLIAMAASLMAVLLNMDVPIIWVILSGIVLCVGAQALTGLLVSRTNVEPFIITLGTMAIYRGIALLISDGSEIPLNGKFQFLGRTKFFDIPTPIFFFVGVSILLILILNYTAFGRRLFAVGENNKAAFLAGINVQNVKVGVYALHGLLVSLAAMILMSRIGVASPNMAAGLELQTIAAAVVGGAALAGGRGSIVSSFIGVILLGVISNSMNIIGVSTFWQYIMLGLVVVTAVVIGSYNRKLN